MNWLQISSLPAYLLSTGHGEAPDFFTWILSTNVINIVIALFLLGFLVKKFNLLSIFETQQDKIRKEVETLEQQKKTALKELNALKKQTKNLSDEVESILKEAKTSAETLSQQILSDAESDVSKIMEASKKRMEVEQRSAMKALEKRLLIDAIDEAHNELAELPNKDKTRSIETFISNLATLNS